MDKRVLWLSRNTPANPQCIIYVMSRDQRINDNHALVIAQQEAFAQKLPLVVVFNLLPTTGVRSREQYQFMLGGLKELEKELKKLDIPFILTIGNMPKELSILTKTLSPRTVYFDFNPLRGPRIQQKTVANQLDCRVAVVDTHNIVPVWVTSDKQEFAAHTIRRKLHKNLEEWLVKPDQVAKHPYTLSAITTSATWADAEREITKLKACGIKHGFKPGEKAALTSLRSFTETGLTNYASKRNDPAFEAQSNLSPYLHFGQLSALRIVLDILQDTTYVPLLLRQPKMPSASATPSREESIDTFIEELIVRRELSDNFCFYNQMYDQLDGAPNWARQSLEIHSSDPREFVYSLREFEDAMTHDDIWNAAQLQLRKSGKIHGYMRMYWAKKILEWSKTPDDALQTAIYLNDHYSIDGGDPNGYVGILWSIAGLHDRPWFERSVYGTIRYMNASGLKRKFDTDVYLKAWL